MSVLRPRRIYWRPTNSFGFGRRRSERPDLVESEFQIGWRVLVICRVDLLDDHQRLADENARIKDLARQASANVSEGMAAIDVEIAKRLAEPAAVSAGFSRTNTDDRENEK